MNRVQRLQVLAILAVFAVAAFLASRSMPGEDLSSSYFGCRVLAVGEPSHLYSRESSSFDIVRDPVWKALAHGTIFEKTSMAHPYVQTPLWAYAIRPLCTTTSFTAFHGFFLVLEALGFSALIWLVARAWTPNLLHPGWMAAVSLLFFVSVPVRYALFLAQTHIIFLLMTVLAIVLARRYPLVAGALLAVAAAVKITPAYLVLYWLLTRKNKAAVSFVVCSAGLVLITVLTTGPGLFQIYLHNLSQTSNVLLVAYNNQSFSAWLMAHKYAPAEFEAWHLFTLPTGLKIASTGLAILSALAGGVLDRRSPDSPPYGAVLTLIACTMLAPIAWSHYFFLLLIPCMMLLAAYIERPSRLLFAILAAIVALNIIPHGAMHHHLHIVRPQFYAAVLSLAGLVLLWRRSTRTAQQGQTAAGLFPVAA